MPVITLANGKEFSAETSETMLDAALRAGLVLEHSCKTGRCGSCKSRVIAGLSQPTADETGLTAAEIADGFILSCVRKAEGDVRLAVQDLGDVKIFPVKTYPAKINSLERLSSDVIRVVLRMPPAQRLEYHPGQYVDVISKGGLRRSYSVANAPVSENTIELHIRQVDGGEMSQYWFEEAAVGDLLRLHGPLGTFFLRDVAGLHLVLLATGTGMAPIKALLEQIRTLQSHEMPATIRVFWGGRVPADLYWTPASPGVAIEYIPVLSRAGPDWAGARGYAPAAVLAAGINLAASAVYACGSVAMIESARADLAGAGLDPHRFYSDAFVSSSHNLKETK